VPNYYAIKAKEVSLEILSTSTKPYYIPFYNSIIYSVYITFDQLVCIEKEFYREALYFIIRENSSQPLLDKDRVGPIED